MKIGFLTNALVGAGVKNLKDIADWAAGNGFQDLEIGPSIPLDEKIFNEVLEEGKIDISTFIFCKDLLGGNETQAKNAQQQLISRIEFASKIGAKKVICSTGMLKESINGINFNPEASVDAVAELFKQLAELAEKKSIKLAFEPVAGMGNIAMSPYMFKIIFDKIGSDLVGLNFDPSHMFWQFIDSYEVIYEFKDRIFHVHGKDTEIMYNELKKLGVLLNSKEHRWWRFRIPGLGDIDWNIIVARLYEIGYDGTISIEHEDPVWRGTEEKVKAGLLKGKQHIQQFFMD